MGGAARVRGARDPPAHRARPRMEAGPREDRYPASAAAVRKAGEGFEGGRPHIDRGAAGQGHVRSVAGGLSGIARRGRYSLRSMPRLGTGEDWTIEVVV